MTSTEPSMQIGRPREFDRDTVLATIVDLFWEQGYAATSIGDVVDRTGLSKSSLYGAFGSKDALYRAALSRYLDDHHHMIVETLRDGSRGLADVEAFLDRIWEQIDTVGEDRGCLMVNTSTELGSTAPDLTELAAQHRALLRTGFEAALQRAVERGEFDAARVADTANALVATAIGVAVMSRGGASNAEVHAHLASAKKALHYR